MNPHIQLTKILSQLFTCLFIVFTINVVFSQQPELDSLRLALASEKDDTLKVHHLNGLSSDYTDQGLFEEARETGEQALQLSKKLKFRKGEYLAYINLGNIDSDNGRNDSALEHYNVALGIAIQLKDKKLETACYNNIGLVFYNTGQFADAKVHFDKSLILRIEIGDEFGAIDSYNNLGNVSTLQGNYTDAVANYYEALKLSEKHASAKGVLNAYNNIGVVFLYQGKYRESLEYFIKSMEVSKTMSDQQMVGNTLNNIGDIYYELGEHTNALSYYHEAVDIRKKISDFHGLAVSYNNIGVIQEKQGLLNAALTNYNEAYLLQQQLHDEAGTTASLLNMAHIQIQNQNYPEARNLLKNSLSISHALGLKDRMRDIYQDLSTLDSLEGNWRSAMANYKIYTTYKDSLLNETTHKEVETLKIEFETEKKEKENISLKLENEKQNNVNVLLSKQNLITSLQLQSEKDQRLLAENLTEVQLDSIDRLTEQKKSQEIIAEQEKNLRTTEGLLNKKRIQTKNLALLSLLGISLLIGVITFLINRVKKRKMMQDLKEVEEKALRAQLKPHFVFNALASIQKYVHENPAIAESYLSKFSHFTQEVLVNSEKKRIPLKDELSMLAKYIELHSLRLKQPIEYKFNVDSGIDSDDTMVPPAIFQPLVENSINHNFAGKDGKGHIYVQFSIEGSLLKCTLEDSCEGTLKKVEIQRDRDQSRKSFGLQIVRDRLDLWSKGKSAKGYLELIPHNAGMRVHLGIPI